MKRFYLLLATVISIYSCSTTLTPPVEAQTTVVSATVTDTDGTSWAYGTVKVQFIPNPNNPNISIYNINGTPLSATVLNQGPVSLGSGGSFSLTVYDNTLVTPVGSQWQYTVCPNATTTLGCGIFTVGAAGATQNLTATVSASIKAPRFAPVSGSYGYVDAEASLSLNPGSTYWNVTSLTQRFWNGAVWISFSGAGSGTVTNFIANSASWPSWLVPSVSNATSTPTLSVSANAIPNSALQNNSVTIGTTVVPLGTAQTSLAGLSSIISTYYGSASGTPIILNPGASATNDLQVQNAAGSVNNLTVDDAGDIIGRVGDILFPPTAQTYWGAASGGPLLVTAAPSGSGAPCLVSGCVLSNANANTQSTSDSSTLLATDQFVKNAIASATAGVASINGQTGIFTFTGPGQSCSGTTCNFSGTGVPDVNLTIVSLTIPANTCYGPASTTTPGTIAMTGLTTAMGVAPTWQGNPWLTPGWGQVGGLSLKVWPDSAGNQADWVVCNPTVASITSGSTGVRLIAQ